MALAMDFHFLLDRTACCCRSAIRPTDGVRDPSCYDLLASEARLASFMAIAKGDAPARHWFRLGRAVTPHRPWGGADLVVGLDVRIPDALAGHAGRREPARTDQPADRERQIDYGRRLGAPWGVSESAFNARDLEFTYQYSNFGVPGLGLKRGLADNAVIAPYATALATMIDPHAAARNFEALTAMRRARALRASTRRSTSRRRACPEGERVAVVRAFMAHHQGMSIVAIANALLDGLMRDRFHADPMVQATELLLQERVPRDVAQHAAVGRRDGRGGPGPRQVDGGRWRTASPWSPTPDTQLLSNGRYSVMLTAAGSGYSTWRDARHHPVARRPDLR